MKIDFIEPCPEKWDWNGWVPDQAIYLHVEGYGKVCVVLNYLEKIAIYHGLPEGVVRLKNTINITDVIVRWLKTLNFTKLYCKYDKVPDKQVVRLITKYLGFTKVSDLLYEREVI